MLFFSAKTLKGSVPQIESHIHTIYSDGKHTIIENIEASIKQGLVHIAFTDHTESFFYNNDPDWFFDYYSQINATRKKYKDRIKISIGVEAPVVDFDGNLDLLPAIKDRAEYVLGTVHRYPGLDKKKRVCDLTPDEMNKLEYKSLLGLVKNSQIDAIAHIGGTCGTYGKNLSKKQLLDIVKQAKNNGVAIEINSKYHNPIHEFLDICMNENCLITLGSDSHTLDSIGTCKKKVEQYLFNSPK